MDNGKALNAFGVGSNHASIERDADGNYYLKATKGTAAASGDPGDYRYWQYFNPAGDGINTYWNEQSAYKFISVEFDIRTKAAMTAIDRIYFSARHQYQNGLQIFGMDSETVAMGEPEAIVKEIKALVADGVTEVMLLGQNVNSYGKTLKNPVTFAQLLEKVEQIEGLKRIRFMPSLHRVSF